MKRVVTVANIKAFLLLKPRLVQERRTIIIKRCQEEKNISSLQSYTFALRKRRLL